MLTDLVPVLGVIFAVGLPLSIPIVYIALNYRKRKRLMELSHAERMAAIERGMEVPPLPLELIDGNSRKRRSSLLTSATLLVRTARTNVGMATASATPTTDNISATSTREAPVLAQARPWRSHFEAWPCARIAAESGLARL